MSTSASAQPLPADSLSARQLLIELGQIYDHHGWLPATSGNLSLRYGDGAIVTASGFDKGALQSESFVWVDLAGSLRAAGRPKASLYHPEAPTLAKPSAESCIHTALYRLFPSTQAVFHIHSPAGTLCTPNSTWHGQPARRFQGLELLKAWGFWEEDSVVHLPIFANHAEVPRIADELSLFYDGLEGPFPPAFLIAGHGITAWGSSPFAASRHLEACEFLCATTLYQVAP